MPDTRELLGVICGVKVRGVCTYEEESKGVLQHHPIGIQDSRELTPLVHGSRES
jgi:hypothetical protein